MNAQTSNATSDHAPLARQILDCFPSGSFGLMTLLRLLDIVETEEVETAAVECRRQPRLLINPRFVQRHAETPEKLFMLVMHELHHVLLGHTRLFPRITPLDNLVFDAVINALLCRLFPEPAFCRFFTDYYSKDRFPECFLRPAADACDSIGNAIPPALCALNDPALIAAYRGLYSPAGVSYEELYEVLRNRIPPELVIVVSFLGDHRPERSISNGEAESSSDGDLDLRSPALLETVREIVERWPQPQQPIQGRSLADILRSKLVRPRRVTENRARLTRLIARIARTEPNTRRGMLSGFVTADVLSPLPRYDRRTIVLRALGRPPLWSTDTWTLRRPRCENTPVHVYLDVSGSVMGIRGALYSAVLECRDLVHPKVHLFSTQVVDVSLAEMKAGKCLTTDGTDSGCVAEHMRKNRVRRAVLVTDGYVGRPTGPDAAWLSSVRLGVALPGECSCRDDLMPFVDAWTTLQTSPKGNDQ